MSFPKGSFKDLYSGVLGITTHCLGETVCYRPKAGGVHTINAVFDEKHIDLDPDIEEFVSSNDPKIGVRLSDIPQVPEEGDRVDIGKRIFEVKDVREDGQGGAEIMLYRIT